MWLVGDVGVQMHEGKVIQLILPVWHTCSCFEEEIPDLAVDG